MEKKLSEWRLGIDDTDSLEGGCTTHFMFEILKKFRDKVRLIEYPLLIRLNPNIPWKTRGNGAVGIRFLATEEQSIEIFEYVKESLPPASERLKRNSGVILIKKEEIDDSVSRIVDQALTSVVDINKVLDLIKKKNVFHAGKGNKRGLIGAISVCGYEFVDDYTYELLLYRKPENYGTKRRVAIESIKELERKYSPRIFSSYDFETNTPLILPRGRDPVLLGIRSKDSSLLKEALKVLDINEPVDGGVIFKTNQGTDDHFKRLKVKKLGFHRVYYDTVEVVEKPERMEGGHVRLLVRTLNASDRFWVVAYEPSKRLREIVSSLLPGDVIWVGGGIRRELFDGKYSLNTEKIVVLRTVPSYEKINPRCPVCGKSLTSKGRGQGYRCKKCGKNYPDAKPTLIPVKRPVRPGLFLPPLSAQRHLTKPLERLCEYGYESKKVANDKKIARTVSIQDVLLVEHNV